MSDPCSLFDTAPCQACSPRTPKTPQTVANRPGLPTLAYRVGTFATFRAAMLDWTASERVVSADPTDSRRSAHTLTSGMSDDYAVAMLELWAYVCDVLTMYQQAYLNESQLRTATLRESLQRIAALLGYAPARGVAATALLAFIADAGASVTVPTGMQLLSAPPPGSTAQTFETGAPVAISDAANTPVLVGAPQNYALHTEAELLAADAAAVATGARIVFRDKNSAVLISEDTVLATWPTRVGTGFSWRGDLGGKTPAANVAVARYNRKFRLFGHQAPPTWLTPTVSGTSINWTQATTEWSMAKQNSTSELALDAVYDNIAAGTRLLVCAPLTANRVKHVQVVAKSQAQAQLQLQADFPFAKSQPWYGVVTVTSVRQDSRSVGPLNAATTVVELQGDIGEIDDLRTVTVYELSGADIPILPVQYAGSLGVSDASAGRTLWVADASGLHQGMTLLLAQNTPSGLQHDLVTIATEPAHGGSGPDAVQLATPLQHDYTPSLAVLYGNIARATAGQTQPDQTLGSGDPTQASQEFALPVNPLTYVPDPASDTDATSTLQVLVNDIAWREVPTLYGAAPSDAVFVTREDENGNLYVDFGDGSRGRRLPAGSGNVHALMRKGVGAAGNAAAGTIVTIAKPLAGLKAVINPVDAYGGADPESPDSIRVNAPSSVVTLGRAVSLGDYEALALTRQGIAKACASWSDAGGRRGVRLTVAASGGRPLADLAAPLADFLDRHRDPNVPLAISDALKVPFAFGATVHVLAAYRKDAVVAAVNAAFGPNGDGSGLIDADHIPIGHALFQSELVRTLQDVPGVEWVELRYFRALDASRGYGDDSERIDALQVAPTEMAWPSLQGDDTTASVDLGFSGGIDTPGGSS